MQRSKRLYKLVALFVVFLSLSAFAGDIENEKDLIKTANKLFEAGKYAECLDYYSTLVSNHPKDPIFSYKYGVCKLYATEDKVESLRYLGFATQKKDQVDPIAFYFFGKALQQNYEFDAAAKQFKIYQSLVKPKEAEEMNVSNCIKECYTAKERIYDFKKMDVVTKKSVGKAEFFRSYRLGSMKRNIIITPDEFLTNADKKSGDYSLIVHHPMNEVIYFSSYNKEGSVGGKDIFKIQKMPDGTFSKPVNLGPTVNTEMDEDYPYLHPNGMVLYFSSKGRNGIGGYDIFKSVLDTATNIWGKAENVGFSINSPGDDLLYVSDMDENIAYFASDRGDKQGQITVYKIFPSKSNTPVIIVRGQVEVEGSRNHSAKVVVYNSEGEELSSYVSQKTGTFVMTLDEAQTYTVGVSAPGRGEAKSSLELPRNSESNMISKKFVLRGGKLILEEASELLATAESRSKLLRESAELNVNQAEDVDFNTKIERPSSSPVNSENDFVSSDVDPAEPSGDLVEEASTESNILNDAREELEEIRQSKDLVKKQINATYLVANKKKIKTELIKDEIEELSEELEMVFTDEEKENIQKQLSQKETELKANVASATAALQLAKSKERELAVQEKQEELAQIYVDAVQEANESGNDSRAIAKLEKSRDELDKVQEEIKRVKMEDGSAESFAKADEAKKKVADLELKNSVLDKDVKDIIQQQEELKKQISATRNKGLKEEFNLQIKELDDELAEIKVERNVNQAKLEEAKSELEVYSSTQNVYDEVYSEADDPSLMPVSEDQKNTIQEEVAVQNMSAEKTLKESDSSYEVPKVGSVESDVSNDISTDDAADEEVSQGSIEESASEEEVFTETVEDEIEVSEKSESIASEKEYMAFIANAESQRERLKSVREELVDLRVSVSNQKNKKDKEKLFLKMSELLDKETQLVRDLKESIQSAKVKESELPDEVLESKSNEINQLESMMEEVQEFEEEIVEVRNQLDQEERVDQTELISMDPETASEEEIKNLISVYMPVESVDLSNEMKDDDIVKWDSQVKELDKKSAVYLVAANKEQVKFEEKGGEGESPKAKKLKEKAIKKQFEKIAIQSQISEKRYTLIKDQIEQDIASLSSTDKDSFKEVSADIDEKWEIIKVKRNQMSSEKDESLKIDLLKESNDLEREVFVLQNALKESMDTMKQEEVVVLEEKIQDEPQEIENTQEELPKVIDEKVDAVTKGIKEEDVEKVEVQEIENEIDSSMEEVLSEEKNIENSSPDDEEDEKTIISDNEVLSEVEKIQNSEENQEVEESPVSEVVFYDSKNPSSEAVEYGNKEGYGIVRNDEFNYTRSEAVIKTLEEAKQEEKIALDYYFEADSLKREAEQNPNKAKELERSSKKLMAKGSKAQDKANDKYRELNEKELTLNKDNVEFAIEYNEIVKVDSAKIILAKADKLFEDAGKVRKNAAKEKSIYKKGDLINEAYNMELEAIALQNYILMGELDGDSSEVDEDVIVREEEPKEINEYTLKADEISKKADEEPDYYKRKALLEEARAYELAGDKKRTSRLMESLSKDQYGFEKNAEIVTVSRKQSNKNGIANEAWAYEKQSDSLYAKAKELKEQASNNTNDVEKLAQIAASNEILEEAKLIQAKAIQKYMESKSVPDEEDFVVDFDSLPKVVGGEADNEEDISLFTEIENKINSQDAENEDVLTVNQTDQVTEVAEVTDVSEELNDQDNQASGSSNELPKENIEQNDSEMEVLADAQPIEESTQKITEVKIGDENESAEEAYKTLIAEANEAEANEVTRVEEIFRLNDLAEENRNKSEAALSEVDGLTNEQEITAKIAEANKYRELAEKFEVDVKSQQMILKNNVAEARSKKKEAELILVGIDESKRSELVASVESEDSDLKKVQEYVAAEMDINSTEDELIVKRSEPLFSDEKTSSDVNVEDVSVNDESSAPSVNEESGKQDDVEYTSPELVEIDMESVALLNKSGAVNDIPEEFSLDSDKRYAPTAEIPVDPPMPKGIIYQVQVGAFRQKIDPGIFNGLSPLVGEQISNGITRYKVGYFRGFTSANIAKGRIRQLGYPDAFVVVFYNGKRITVEKAEEVISAADESEQFVYKNLVMDEVKQLKSLGIANDEGDELLASSEENTEINTASPDSKALTPSAENGLSNDLLKINGLFYTVQVGVYKTPRSSSDLYGLSPLYTEKTSNGYLRYTTGMYKDYNSADQKKEDVRNQGIRDAFVTAYKDNKRISVAQARQEEDSDNNASANSGSNKQGDSSSGNAEVVFKVQVGAYRTPISVETTPVFKDLTNYEVSSLKTSSGLLIYMVGSFKTKAEADNLRQVVVNYGGKDCFVVALVNGKRIPIKRALELVGN
ncbi:MAG: hypothetical protein CMP67_11270 [Flavobacteriales bacterium]|nr:hypothetical protein [Flavobacteriales bacterium]